LIPLLLAMLAAGPQTAPGTERPFERRTPVVRAVELAGPAVVNINTEGTVQQVRTPYEQFFERFFERFRRPEVTPFRSLGSGVLVHPTGLVVTNEHVVRNARTIRVHLAGGSEASARVVGAEPRFDLAVLQIEASRTFSTVRLGRSDDILIGETVIALGNPFGLENTVTTGVVSAQGRDINSQEGGVFRDLLQTDASINPGNSGGALLNINAELIGINSAVYAQADGIGFAIPIDVVRLVLKTLLAPDSWIGLEVAPRADATGLPVRNLDQLGPAEEAGLRRGDRIVSLDGQPAATDLDVVFALHQKKPRESLEVALDRGGERSTIQVPVQKMPARRARRAFLAHLRESWGRGPEVQAVFYIEHRLGLRTVSLDDTIRARLGPDAPKDGVVVLEVVPGGPAENFPIREGDVIQARVVGEDRKTQPIVSVPALARMLLQSISPGQSLELEIAQGDERKHVALKTR
jgi:serine protease Do